MNMNRCVHCMVEEPEADARPRRHCAYCRDVLNQPCPGCDCGTCFPPDEKAYLAELLAAPVPMFDPYVEYHGFRRPAGVTVLRRKPGWPWEELDPRLDLRTHSPCGFEWGYGGSGPAQLAIALAADATCDRIALKLYQELKRVLISGLCKEEWWITSRQVIQYLTDLCASDD